MKVFRSILSTYKLSELVELTDRADTVQFYPPGRAVLSVPDSYRLIHKVLNHQMSPVDKDFFLKFLNDLLTHKSGKFNCLLISGPPSVGKTWFGNIVGKLMINTGYIANCNRYSQFPFRDCPRRNFLIFDEPNVEPASLESFKLLFAGTPTPANVKYESQNLINRTPVLVTCNRDPFPNSPEFDSRIRRFRWNVRLDDLLENVRGEVHPHGLLRILEECERPLGCDDGVLRDLFMAYGDDVDTQYQQGEEDRDYEYANTL